MGLLYVQIFSGSRPFWAGIDCQLRKERRKNKIMSLRVGGTSKQNIIGLCRQKNLDLMVSLTSSLNTAMENYYRNHKSCMHLGLGKGIE